MKIAVPKERAPGERRVALVPEIVAKFVKEGHTLAVERGAGTRAGYRCRTRWHPARRRAAGISRPARRPALRRTLR